MYRLTILLLFLSFVAATIKAQRNDTSFISRKVTKDYYHAVYIERNRQSENYHDLLNFKMDQWALKGCKENLTYLKKRKPLTGKTPASLPREWMPLNSYKGKYYIYSPCEWGYIGRRILTDSTLIYWMMEPPTPERIHSIKKIDAQTYYILCDSFYTNDEPLTKIIIHIIDSKSSMAVWESTSPKGTKEYNLMIPRKSAVNFDMIVNHCEQNKQPEFEFDKIDFKKLLKSH